MSNKKNNTNFIKPKKYFVMKGKYITLQILIAAKMGGKKQAIKMAA
jgi:hypothetical protein